MKSAALSREAEKKMEPYMDTLAETLRRFEERGFRAAFRAHPDGGLTVDGEEIFAPEELVVEDFARFEGVSDPDDESVLFALRTADGRVRGTFSTTYGIHADPHQVEAVRRLRVRSERMRRPMGESA